MFKKISSNQDPDVTVTSEIKREFSKYFTVAEQKSKGFISSHSKQVFIGMLVAIAFSLIMCFIVFSPSQRQNEKMPHYVKESAGVATNVSDGIGQTYRVGEKVYDLIKLREQVEQVLKKPKLTHQDTLFLEEAIKQFEIHQQKPKK
ncbi:hypothetical protein DHW03_18825 [Pedobacter yonginense]|uniref:Uncharacterized protein n=1 Tax=Pedobacter yonginense TaxID=651869 RepID=A0A317EIF8_9SPHI|nr:hypothetical protein [Pedobacter yonginense]PWS25889.1 hypothetical protein DHW03_18825 [Pedobacter yonginense]